MEPILREWRQFLPDIHTPMLHLPLDGSVLLCGSVYYFSAY
jgi:hypothetical protein